MPGLARRRTRSWRARVPWSSTARPWPARVLRDSTRGTAREAKASVWAAARAETSRKRALERSAEDWRAARKARRAMAPPVRRMRAQKVRASLAAKVRPRGGGVASVVFGSIARFVVAALGVGWRGDVSMD